MKYASSIRDLAGSSLASISSGVLVWAAQPPQDVWPLIFVAWVPLLLSIRHKRPGPASILGGVQGFTTHALLYNCLPQVTLSFGAMPYWACLAISCAIFMYSASMTASAAMVAAFVRRNRWPEGVAFALAVFVGESFYPLLVPTYSATALHRAPLLTQIADIGGPAFVGLPILFVNVAIAELLAASVRTRAVPWRHLVLGGAAIGSTCVYGHLRMRQMTEAMNEAPPGRVGIVQGNTPHSTITLKASVDRYRELSEQFADGEGGRVDVLVWPETAIASAFTPADLQRTLRDYVAHAPDGSMPLPAPVLSGVMTLRGRRIANSAVLFTKTGDVVGVYDKVHPLVMGEYIPWGDKFPWLYRYVTNAGHIVAGGEEQSPIVLDGHVIAPFICYESIIPDFVRRTVKRTRPDLLVNLTNDSWFGASGASSLHFALAQFRSIEHRRFLVDASNSGVSGVVDALGRPFGETKTFEKAHVAENIRWMRVSETLYEGVGDLFAWIALIFLGAGIAFRRPVLERLNPAKPNPQLQCSTAGAGALERPRGGAACRPNEIPNRIERGHAGDA